MSQQVVISYTTREYEVQQVTPLIEALVRELKKRDEWHGLKQGFNQYFWFDRAQLPERAYSDEDLADRLHSAIHDSRKMLVFVSPCYWPSRWCRFEWCAGEQRGLPTLPIVWKGGDGPLMQYGEPILPSFIPDFFPPGERRRVVDEREFATFPENPRWMLDEREFALSPEDYLRSRRFFKLTASVHSFVMSGLNNV